MRRKPHLSYSGASDLTVHIQRLIEERHLPFIAITTSPEYAIYGTIISAKAFSIELYVWPSDLNTLLDFLSTLRDVP